MNSLPERFRHKVEKQADGCWLWLGAKNALGYGSFAVGRSSMLAHRYAYEALRNENLDGRLLRHTCDNPSCVNPDHLIPGTSLENMADQVARGRRADFKGTRNPRAKLNVEQVAEIRKRYVPGRVLIIDLAAEFQVSKSQIWNIVSGREWNESPK